MEKVVVKCDATNELATYPSEEEAYEAGILKVQELAEEGYNDDDCKVTLWSEDTHEYLGSIEFN